MHHSFPEKTDEEIKALARKFYSHFCDVLIETLKSFTISRKFLEEHITAENAELVQRYYDKKRSVIGITSHYGNWEWAALAFSSHSQHKHFGIYSPLKNKFWNEKIKQSRRRFGLNLVAVADVAGSFKANIKHPCMYGFISDQTPSNIKRCHWMKFLNQDTPVLLGAERYARHFNCVVLFADITKQSRGKYSIKYELITDDPSSTTDTEITEKHVRLLEGRIRAQPEYWLWTHRRWKRKRLHEAERDSKV